MPKDEWSEVKNSFWKKGKVGDFIIGTLIAVREIKSQLPGRENEYTKLYEIKADMGEFHDLDDKNTAIEPAIKINAEEIWNVGGGSKEHPAGIDTQFRNIKLGQKVKIEFVDEKPPKQKGFSPLKVVKVYTNGKMDENWLKEQEANRGLDGF